MRATRRNLHERSPLRARALVHFWLIHHARAPMQPMHPTPQIGKEGTCRNTPVGNKAPKKAVGALINLSVLTAAAATVEANAAPKKGRPADPASIYAVGMVRPSSPQVPARMFDHVAYDGHGRHQRLGGALGPRRHRRQGQEGDSVRRRSRPWPRRRRTSPSSTKADAVAAKGAS